MGTSRTVVQRILGAASAAALLMGFGAVSQEAAAGISNTRHNLSSVANSIVGRNQSTTTTDLCVFCHTPHGADTSAVPAGSVRPPLWNKTLPASAGFTTYPSTGAREVLAVGSVSIACLSCHDGSQAMDNIINAPGPGDRIALGGGATGRAYVWQPATGGGVNADGIMVQRANGAAMLGKDLSDDHPIGVKYCGGFGASGLLGTGTCRENLNGSIEFREPLTVTVAGATTWYVDTPGNLGGASVGQRDKSDMHLYTRQFTGVAGATPSVECGSCHDPHVEAQAQGQVSFLRVSNAGSNLCLVCHNK